MLFWTIVKVAISSLVSNKLRSLLSMLGIIIGVAAVITMLAVGQGAQKMILDRVSAMGADLLIVRPGQGGRRGVRGGDSQNLNLDDAKAILRQVEGVKLVTPQVQGQLQFKAGNRNSRTNVLGAAPTYFTVRNTPVKTGRAFTDGEVERNARVAVIGADTAKNLFGDENALGETIRLGKVNVEVIGILERKGDQGFFNPDDQAVVPYSLAMKQLLGVKSLREIDVQIDPKVDQAMVQKAIEDLLRKRHKIRQGAEDDFHVRNVAEMIDTAQSVTDTFTLLLGAVAAISLIVGGIGIMNIMLVTVTERTREIGIRKALGATNEDVLIQFLLEAMIMSLLGGGIGLVSGVGGARAITYFAQFPTVVSSSSAILAISFSAGVGIFFGFYPARSAASLDPIECLRYE